MATAKQTTRGVEKVNEQPIVETAWAADRGVIVAILSRTDTDGSIFQLIDLADQLDLNGEIEVHNDWMHDGRKRDAVVLTHQDRV